MAQSKTSKRWLKEHFDDPFVKQAQKDGYRSRASYKLLEIQERDRILKPGMTVLDLGAAPGGWSQVAARLIGEKGRIIASDILAMDSIPDVTFIQGDFTEDAVFEAILAAIGDTQVDLVISDMAPNMSGMDAIDQPKGMYLAELALELAREVSAKGASYVVKVFQGEGFDEYIRQCRQSFDKVMIRKPDASRARSREVYVVGQGYKG